MIKLLLRGEHVPTPRQRDVIQFPYKTGKTKARLFAGNPWM